LADPRAYECTGDAQNRREYEPLRIVRTGQKKSGDDAGDEADHEDPDKTSQSVPPMWSAQKTKEHQKNDDREGDAKQPQQDGHDVSPT
jgi:hypothetical protein